MAAERARAETDAHTGLPWPRTWRGVYCFVLGCFATSVLLLTALTLLFA
ncbi:MAG TPA: hypothetical protein VGD81_12770 [Opitutaceae bacterium]